MAAIVNEHHKRVAERLNASIKEPEEFNWGNLVWFLRPPLSHGRQGFAQVGRPVLHQGAMWPAQLYHRDTASGGATCAQAQLKPFHWNSPEGIDFPLHYFRLKPQEEKGKNANGRWRKFWPTRTLPKGPDFSPSGGVSGLGINMGTHKPLFKPLCQPFCRLLHVPGIGSRRTAPFVQTTQGGVRWGLRAPPWPGHGGW